MEPISIDLGQWLPDLDPLDNPGCLEALNCIPEKGYYRQLNSLVSYAPAVTPVPHSGFWVESSNGVVFTFLGTDNGLFLYNIGTQSWDDVSNGGFSPSGASHWQFARFGSRVIAVTPEFNPQYFDVDLPSATFLDLPGSPPIASDVAVVRDFVFIIPRDSGRQNRVQWSGFNNSELWIPDLTTQSDFQDLQGDIGKVQRIVPGDSAHIFCEHSIFRCDYTGGNLIFQFDEIARGRGTPAPYSVTWLGDLIFYYAHDGFFMLAGEEQVPIGLNRVDRYFRNSIAATDLNRVQGAIDRTNKLVVWSWPLNNTTFNNQLLIYNWGNDAWARAEVDMYTIFEDKDSGLSLDALDTIFPLGIDQQSILVDSPDFAGGTLRLAVMDSNKQAATFAGPALDATFITKETTRYQRFLADSIRPEVHSTSGAVVQCSVGYRNTLTSSVLWSPDSTVGSNLGEAFVRVDSRYQRYRMKISGGFTHTTAATIRGRMTGRQ